MARLLEVYDEMIKEAEVAEMAEQVATMFAKYAEEAESLLAQEYGKDFDGNDVESLARGLMERDSDTIEEQEKIAEYDAIGRELANRLAESIKTANILDPTIKAVRDAARHIGSKGSLAAMMHPGAATGIAAGALGAAGLAGRMSKGDK
jgi:hypothetical protein